MNIDGISDTFLSTVGMLLERNGKKKICIATNKGRYINFRSPDFQKSLQEVISQRGNPAEYKEYMKAFRTLEYIICKPGRYTNTQFIDKKSVRVITVSNSRYLYLKHLQEKDI